MRSSSLFSILTLVAALLLAALPGSAQDAAHSWGYRGEAGKVAPADWPGECQTGLAQSPVNLTRSASSGKPAAAIAFHYQAARSEVRDNGHAIEVSALAGHVEVAGVTYQLCDFHFHTPSEHTWENVGAPAEVHFVHKVRCDGASGILVIGALIEPASSEHPGNATLAAYLRNLQHLPATTPMLNPGTILQASGYAQYSGSLTTPSCAEPVSWFVAQEPIYLKKKVLKRLSAAYPNNSRPGQSLGDRKLHGL